MDVSILQMRILRPRKGEASCLGSHSLQLHSQNSDPGCGVLRHSRGCISGVGSITFRESAYGGTVWVPHKCIWPREHGSAETHCSPNYVPWSRAALVWKKWSFFFAQIFFGWYAQKDASYPIHFETAPCGWQLPGCLYLEGVQVSLTIALILSLLRVFAPTPKGTLESAPNLCLFGLFYMKQSCLTWKST